MFCPSTLRKIGSRGTRISENYRLCASHLQITIIFRWFCCRFSVSFITKTDSFFFNISSLIKWSTIISNTWASAPASPELHTVSGVPTAQTFTPCVNWRMDTQKYELTWLVRRLLFVYRCCLTNIKNKKQVGGLWSSVSVVPPRPIPSWHWNNVWRHLFFFFLSSRDSSSCCVKKM